MLIKNGKIYTMENREIFIGDIRILDGHISEIGAHLEQLEDEDVLDATNKYVYPGLVEAHCHLGMDESSIRMEGNDVNESSDPVTPHVRAIDGCNPMDETIRHACEAGVTTVAAGPGSANVIGGTFMVYKTYGNCIDDMVIKNPVAMKCAFGENPKRVYQESKIKTRMNIAALLRENFI